MLEQDVINAHAPQFYCNTAYVQCLHIIYALYSLLYHTMVSSRLQGLTFHNPALMQDNKEDNRIGVSEVSPCSNIMMNASVKDLTSLIFCVM